MKEKFKLTRRQWAVVAVLGLGTALVRTPTLPAAAGYTIGSLPLAYLTVLIGARLLGFVGGLREKASST